jgi:hypothetical protein
MGLTRFQSWNFWARVFWAIALGVPAAVVLAFALRVALATPQ